MTLLRVRAAVSLLALLSCSSIAPATAGQGLVAREVAAEANANTRYIVESVQITGDGALKLTKNLQLAFQQLVGTHFDPSQLDELALEMRKELHLKSVTPHLNRGSQPDLVKIDFEVHRRSIVFDVSLPKFLYHSKQGWSAEGIASTTIARTNRLSFGLVSDGDALTERFAGSAAVYENSHVGTDRIHARFEFDNLHEQWNRDTLLALNADPKNPRIYRARRVYQPSLSFTLARPLTLEIGASLQQLEMQSPETPGALESPTDHANAVFATLRFHEQYERSGQEVGGSYNFRAAGNLVHSDFSYQRHYGTLTYSRHQGNQTIQDDFTAGFISGRAPFFERFVVGTSSLLRGWNRFEIDPLGGTRLLHNSVTYRYRFPQVTGEVFYDAGSLWHGNGDSGVRHSLGLGLSRNIFTLAVAFPVRDGRIDPVFMVGMNY